jgi:hypothetical protein
MDDFLHNLRTGKNKPYDRNRKQYDNNGFKSSDRQNLNDNRRKDTFQRTPLVDYMPLIKKHLGEIIEEQKRQYELEERRVAAEERIADALENLSVKLFQKSQAPISSGVNSETLPLMPNDENLEVSGDTASPSVAKMERNSVLKMIAAMRNDQMSYEKIARALEAQGIPTFSGKGSWHSQTVSKLCHQLNLSPLS